VKETGCVTCRLVISKLSNRYSLSFLSFQMPFLRVGLLESAALSGWYTSSKAKYWHETDSKQVPWGKGEKYSEKRVKQYVKPLKGKLMEAVSFLNLFYPNQVFLPSREGRLALFDSFLVFLLFFLDMLQKCFGWGLSGFWLNISLVCSDKDWS